MLHKRTRILVSIVALFLLAAGMIAAYSLFRTNRERAARPTAILKKAVPNMDWPVFRGNQNLSGFADAVLADEFELAWTFTTGAAIESVPIINKETIFASSADGKIYALGRDKGDLIWEFDSGAPIEASALYFKNTVYAGNRNGVLYALDAGTGREKWKYATGNKITGSANYAEISEQQYIILIGSYDNAMHALDANTGKQLWEYTAKSYINGAPSVFKNSMAFGGCDSFLRILEVGTGKEIAGVEMGSYIASSVCYFEGNIYLAHYGGNIVCFSLQENKILWQYPKDSSVGPFLGSPAVNMEKVVIGSQDKKLYAVNRFTGELVWTFDTKGEVKSSPVIFGSKLVAGSSDGRLYILNLDDGALLWSYEIGAEISGFAVTGGMIIAAAGTGVYAFKSDFVRAQNSKYQFRNH